MVLVVGKVIERGLGWGELVTPRLVVVVRGGASNFVAVMVVRAVSTQ